MTIQNSVDEFQRAGRLEGIELSEIVQISEHAARLRAQGVDVIALSTGEPDFPTPPHVVDAAHRAALEGQTRYPATAGTPTLRAAIAGQVGVEPANVIVSTGAKQVLSAAFMATLNPGDEVITTAPFWTSYADMVKLAGGVPVVLDCPVSQDFKLTPEQLENAITPQTRWLLLNTPSNPTGAVYSEAELQALGKVLENHPQVWVISDEIYQHLTYVPFTPFVKAVPALTNRTLIVNGVSKAYSMTGWRIGWGIGPAPLIKAMVAVQGQITSGACSIAQAAALEAITGPQELLAERRSEMQTRRDLVVDGLNQAGLSCATPDGAFYVFPKTPVQMPVDHEFCRYLLDEAGVALVPGRAFGMPGHLRLSFAYATDSLTEGLARITRAVAAL
ncbi:MULTISPECIES: pyridoxal phosphate-dependent aminotransferase [Alphaproteobacteria]|uniref:pyridoxal phosphate-dependent aminotransferase n=1 Tax=Alphaproteobacteria TaxID=28211 RepID=UPI0012BB4A5A|nr:MULTISPECIES: pyridoxal phosphate-dependent aminotransferase [Alphaproteobacteria]MTH99020.1 pyridoxal phosphate-dependent aminotransferase [Roseibium sp. RKSG952]